MPFINWGEETPEHKKRRSKYEEEQQLFEQSVRMIRRAESQAGAVASGKLPNQPTLAVTLNTDTNTSQPYITLGFYNGTTDPLELNIDWGDGTKEKYVVTNDWIYPEHYYATPGEKTVLVKSKRFDLLTNLYFMYSRIVSLTGLNLLTGLTQLNLGGNSFTEFGEDFTWPPNLTNLLLYDNNKLTSFNPVNKLPDSLSEIILGGSLITEVKMDNQTFPNLNSLTINSTQIQNANFTGSAFPNLQFLTLSYNKIQNFIVTGSMPALTQLNLGSNQISSFTSDISQLTNLTYLAISDCQMTSFNPSVPLPSKLEQLQIQNNQLTSFDPTYQLPNSLRELSIFNNQLTTFSPTHPLPSNLQLLLLYSNNLSGITPVNPLPTSLITLSLANNNISAVDSLLIQLPTGLENLYLAQNKIQTYTSSVVLPSSLRILDLQSQKTGYKLTSFSPGVALPSLLRNLFLGNNQLTSFTTVLPNLELIDISFNLINTLNISSGMGSRLENFWAQNNKLSTASINTCLVRLSQITVAGPGAKFIRLQSQSPPAPPSGVGLTAKANLQAKYYNVYTD